MKLACALTTAPRRVSYLDDTVDSLRNGSFTLSLVSADAGLARRTFDIGVPVIHAKHRLGPLGNFKQAYVP